MLTDLAVILGLSTAIVIGMGSVAQCVGYDGWRRLVVIVLLLLIVICSARIGAMVVRGSLGEPPRTLITDVEEVCT